MEKVYKSLSDLEECINEAIKIVSKGQKMGYFDAIKLGSKNGAIVKAIKRADKEYEVCSIISKGGERRQC